MYLESISREGVVVVVVHKVCCVLVKDSFERISLCSFARATLFWNFSEVGVFFMTLWTL